MVGILRPLGAIEFAELFGHQYLEVFSEPGEGILRQLWHTVALYADGVQTFACYEGSGSDALQRVGQGDAAQVRCAPEGLMQFLDIREEAEVVETGDLLIIVEQVLHIVPLQVLAGEEVSLLRHGINHGIVGKGCQEVLGLHGEVGLTDVVAHLRLLGVHLLDGLHPCVTALTLGGRVGHQRELLQRIADHAVHVARLLILLDAARHGHALQGAALEEDARSVLLHRLGQDGCLECSAVAEQIVGQHVVFLDFCPGR